MFIYSLPIMCVLAVVAQGAPTFTLYKFQRNFRSEAKLDLDDLDDNVREYCTFTEKYNESFIPRSWIEAKCNNTFNRDGYRCKEVYVKVFSLVKETGVGNIYDYKEDERSLPVFCQLVYNGGKSGGSGP